MLVDGMIIWMRRAMEDLALKRRSYTDGSRVSVIRRGCLDISPWYADVGGCSLISGSDSRFLTLCSSVHQENNSMTLRFNMGREDVLEFSRQYHLASPTYRRTRMRVRWMLPIIMIGLWALTTSRSGFDWTATAIFLGVGLLWFIFYLARYDRNVQKYCEKTVDEGSYHKNFGECELTFSD